MSTYQITPAQDVCGDLPVCGPIPAPIEGALTCTPIGDPTQGGFPRAGGVIQFQLWSAICPPATQPSLNLCFRNPLYLRMCAALPAYGNEYDPTQWVTDYSYFSTVTSVQGTAAQFRARAVITVPSQTELAVTIYIDFLNQDNSGNNTWVNWLTQSNTMQLQGSYGLITGLAYKSNPEYISVTPSLPGPNCEVKYISLIAGVQPLLYGCGTSVNDQTCGLWNGSYFYTCFRGELFSKSNSQYPKPFMCAMNASTCGAPGNAFCQCDQCEIVSGGIGYTCSFNSDPTFVDWVNTGFESVGQQQQIQIGYDTSPLNIMIKSVAGSLYFYWRNPSLTTTWTRSSGTLIQESPLTIYSVEDSDWVIYFYAMRYPNASILPDCNQQTLYEMKAPEEIMAQFNIKDTVPEKDEVVKARSAYLDKIKMVLQNPCRHLEGQIEQQKGCNCVQSPKFKCNIFGECLKYTSRDVATAVCTKCDHYQPFNNEGE